METFRQTLVHFPILALFLAIGIGYLFGEIGFFGFRFGIAGVLFAGLAIGALDPGIALPEIIPTLGLIIFVYMVGLHSGPALVQTIRERGYRDSAFAAAVLGFGAAMAYASSWILNLSGASAAGLFCGAVTNTPALAAARETVRELAGKSGMTADQVRALGDQPVVSYSIAYPVGVVGVLLMFQLLRKLWRIKPVEDEQSKPIEVRDFVVRNPDLEGETLAAVCHSRETQFAVSRIHQGGRTEVATPATRLELGTVVAVVGDSDAHAEAGDLFGEPSTMRIEGDNAKLSIAASSFPAARWSAAPLPTCKLERFPATVTRIRRGDTETVAMLDMRLEYGDMLRVLTHRNKTKDVRKLSRRFRPRGRRGPFRCHRAGHGARRPARNDPRSAAQRRIPEARLCRRAADRRPGPRQTGTDRPDQLGDPHQREPYPAADRTASLPGGSRYPCWLGVRPHHPEQRPAHASGRALRSPSR